MAYPIGAYGEDVDTIFLDVVNLLTDIVFDDDFIGKARSLYCLHTFEHIVAHVELTTTTVEAVAGDTYDEIVAKCLRPSQQVDMPLVQQVIGTICDDFFHDVKTCSRVKHI